MKLQTFQWPQNFVGPKRWRRIATASLTSMDRRWVRGQRFDDESQRA
jgi:hypothetical protein